jgi:hypothetical protein
LGLFLLQYKGNKQVSAAMEKNPWDCGIFHKIGVGVHQHKEIKTNSLAIGRKPCAYRIGTPQ